MIRIRRKMLCKKALNMMNLKGHNKKNQNFSKKKLFVIKMKTRKN